MRADGIALECPFENGMRSTGHATRRRASAQARIEAAQAIAALVATWAAPETTEEIAWLTSRP
jgi:hypothetical protein